MPQSIELQTQSSDDYKVYAYEDVLARLSSSAAVAMKQEGFTKTLKSLNKLRLTGNKLRLTGNMMTIIDGVAGESSPGKYDLAVQTDEGPAFFQNAERTACESPDPQCVPTRTQPNHAETTDSIAPSPDQLLQQLADAGANPSYSLLCEVELTRFDTSQHQALLPLLWQYILDHRNSNNRDQLVAVGSAVRKYIAIMPMENMGDLAVLLESGQRSPLPIELEIEVTKMIYRNFKVHPPLTVNLYPKLAERLWEIVQAYTNPRILLHDKHPAVASLAIEAIVSMRSPLAEQAWQAAIECPYGWFAEIVNDGLDDLNKKWDSSNPDAAAWLRNLRIMFLAS